MLLRCACFLSPGLLAIFLSGLRPALAQETAEADREYVLETNIFGYWGVGGDIDGVRNPVLRAEKGEAVRIVIVNIEALVHDLALETLQVKTKEILDVGEQTDLTFTAVEDDIYYCTIPGHRAAGMEGRFEIIREGGVADGGPAPGNEATDAPRTPLLSELPPPDHIPLPPLELPPRADLPEPAAPSSGDWADFLDDPNEQVRAWAVRRLANNGQIPEYILPALARMAREDSSSLARAYLAETLRRIEPERRWDILEGLHGHATDPANHALPLLVWYATEDVVPVDMDRALTLALDSKWPHALSFTVQRIAAEGSQEALRALAGRLPKATAEQRTILLNGVRRIVQTTDP